MAFLALARHGRGGPGWSGQWGGVGWTGWRRNRDGRGVNLLDRRPKLRLNFLERLQGDAIWARPAMRLKLPDNVWYVHVSPQ